MIDMFSISRTFYSCYNIVKSMAMAIKTAKHFTTYSMRNSQENSEYNFDVVATKVRDVGNRPVQVEYKRTYI